MSVFKTTFSRALNVFASNDANIPYPYVITSGTNTSTSSGQLRDNTTDFTLLNIKEGDIAYNITNGTAATIIIVKNSTQLDLNADIFTAIDQEYVIYQASPQTGLGNQGCYIYIGDADTNYEVVTIGGDQIIFIAPIRGTVLPLQIIKLISGGNCVALW
jgi:hypothetical protein